MSSSMATDSQVALTRAHRGSTHLSKATRQVVPAFLQKLYEMVNDPSNADLIRWSEAGDSFFVLDHERFAREVLGRWFKHQNFSSFVRQLNMYGFHKIPHLQAGVLRSDADTEFWNFEHPNFHRGQPDLLCLIQRKKQAAQPGEDSNTTATIDVRDPSHSMTGNVSGPALSAGQVLDIHSIIQGIAAIKRHQQTISSELNELRKSNQMLWQDALAARARHQKHQDTINRILKFLAGVFGHNSGQAHKDDGVESSPHPVFPRNTQRLMIEEAPKKDTKFSGFVRVEEENDADMPEIQSEGKQPSAVHFPTIETPKSISSPYIDPSGPPSPTISEATSYSTSAPLTDAAAHKVGAPLPSKNQNAVLPQNPIPAQTAQSPSLAPLSSSLTTTNPTSNADPDNMLQTFQSLLQSPGQFQRLLSALTNQTIPDSLQPSDVPSQQLAQFPGTYDFSRSLSPTSDHFTPQGLLSAPPSVTTKPPSEGLIPFDPPMAESTQRLDHTWKASQDIDRDVNALHSTLSSFINTLGFDPALMDSTPEGESSCAAPDASSSLDPSITPMPPPSGLDNMPMDTTLPEFDLDAFLTEYGNNQPEDYGDIASTAFLDEALSPSEGSTSPVVTMLQDFAESPKVRGRKRKSDVTELEDPTIKNNLTVPAPMPGGGSKSKRKR